MRRYYSFLSFYCCLSFACVSLIVVISNSLIFAQRPPADLDQERTRARQALSGFQERDERFRREVAQLTQQFLFADQVKYNHDIVDDSGDNDNKSRKRVVLVIGAHGRTGQKILEELVLKTEHSSNTPLYLPIAMVRSRDQEINLQTNPILSGKIVTVIADLESPIDFVFDVQQQLQRAIHTVIFAAGSKKYNNVANVEYAGAIRAFATARKFDSVKRFIAVSGTNVAKDYKSSVLGVKQWGRAKWFVDEFIRDSDDFFSSRNYPQQPPKPEDARTAEFSWTIVCPAVLTNEETDKVVGRVDIGPEWLVSRDLPNYAETTKGKGIFKNNAKSSRRNVAKVIVESIDEPATFKKTFRVLDGEVPISEALRSKL